MPVAECLGEPAARTHPAAIGALAPTPHDERNDDEGLQRADREPQPHRLVGKEIPDEERPGEHEAEGAPVFAAVTVVRGREELVAEPLAGARIEGTVVTRPR